MAKSVKGAGRWTDIDMLSDNEIRWRRHMLAALALLGFASLALLAYAPVHRVAFAVGELRPIGDIAVVKHVTGGEVAEVYVEANAAVAAGDPLVLLDGERLDADLAQLQAQRGHAELRRARLQALLDEADFSPRDIAAIDATDIASARRLFASDRASLANDVATFAARIAEVRATTRATAASLRSARIELAAYVEQAQMSKSLADRGIGTRRALLSAEAKIAEIEQRVAELSGRRDASESMLEQLRSDRDSTVARRFSDWSSALAETAREIANLDASIARVRSQSASLLTRAPIPGRVLEIGVTSSGDVLAPGGLVARIVPTGDGGAPALRAHVRVAPEDIGHIGEGDEALVTVTAFDADLFGEIVGRVRAISPSSLIDEQGQPFFAAELEIDRAVSRHGALEFALAPGMVIQAQLTTAKGTLLSYVLEPVTQALEVSFTE